MQGKGVIGGGGYQNQPDSWPAGWPAACPLSRYVRQAGTSTDTLSGLFRQAPCDSFSFFYQ